MLVYMPCLSVARMPNSNAFTIITTLEVCAKFKYRKMRWQALEQRSPDTFKISRRNVRSVKN